MWEYKAPRDEKVIVNGTDTWIYKKSQKQAVRTRFSKEAYSQVPIALLNNLENLRADFDITLLNETRWISNQNARWDSSGKLSSRRTQRISL